MSIKPVENKYAGKKSTLVISSISAPPNVDVPEGVEQTEITAHITVPTEGGWGWVVVFASFLCFFILDGVLFTFGSIYKSIAIDLELPGTLIALVNSVAIALYYMCGPVVSALVNRFGFRACTMSGSVILYCAYLSSYFVAKYGALLLFYGVITGFGACLILVPSSVIVGFYFERYRPIALALSGLGSSVGIMIMYIVNTQLVNKAGWRIVTLIHAALFGVIFFVGMAYRPLLIVKLTQTTGMTDPTRTVTYLPSLNKPALITPKSKLQAVTPTDAERFFLAVSNRNFPTAISVVQESTKTSVGQAGPSTQPLRASKFTVSVNNIRSVSRKHLDAIQQQNNLNIEIAEEDKKKPKAKWWARFCCEWEEHVPESRPMYRDDAFYGGEIEKLICYHQSVSNVEPEDRTGFEYQLAVSRAVTVADLEDNKGIFTTAARRVLATMLDLSLLKTTSFLLICCSAALTYTGVLTPFIFISDRAKSEGIEDKHCSLFVSVIGLCCALGRLAAGVIASKFKALLLYLLSCIFLGVTTAAFNFSFNVYYQYSCCVAFGLFSAIIAGLRSMLLVETYGLDKLTNATGMLLLAQGFGSLISTPLSGILKETFNYSVSFYVAGLVIILSGLVLVPVKIISDRDKKDVKNKLQATKVESKK